MNHVLYANPFRPICPSVLKTKQWWTAVSDKKNQTKYSFPNGYGASVISGEGIRQFEVAVLDGEELCYTTEITDDVIAGLSVEGVYKILDKIKNLC